MSIMWKRGTPDPESAAVRRAEKRRIAALWALVQSTTWTGHDGNGCYTYAEVEFGGDPAEILAVPPGSVMPAKVSPGCGNMRRLS